MLIFAVDPEPHALSALCHAVREAAPTAEVRAFDQARDVLGAIEQGDRPDVLFLEGSLPDMDGAELVRRAKEPCPWINAVFVTEDVRYMRDALSLHASGYLLKPVQGKDVKTELEDLRYPVTSAKRVRFQCFGNFEVFIDGKPVTFARAKTKEYLAYLVDRGTLCSGKEIAAALWENTVSLSYLRILRKDLFDTLNAAGCGDVLWREWKKQGVRADLVDCDYYDWKKGLPYAARAYRGEYMAQYTWAELTHGTIEK